MPLPDRPELDCGDLEMTWGATLPLEVNIHSLQQMTKLLASQAGDSSTVLRRGSSDRAEGGQGTLAFRPRVVCEGWPGVDTRDACDATPKYLEYFTPSFSYIPKPLCALGQLFFWPACCHYLGSVPLLFF